MATGKGGLEARARRTTRTVLFAGRLLACLALASAVACDEGDQQPSLTPTPSRAPSRSATPRPSPSPATALTPSPTAVPPADTPAITTAPPGPPAATVSPLLPIDKQRGLPASYVPPDLVTFDAGLAAPGFGGLLLRAEAAAALSRMLSAAAADGHDVRVRSAYRSYAEQERTFAYWVGQLGEAEARRVSAEAGHSEHQLGTTADLTTADIGYDLTEAFGDTAAGRWLADNAATYGFALSYPAATEAITGYAYEPWHFRYVGPEHATAWKTSGLTLVEYLRGVE